MSTVVFDISMSLDGFVTASGRRPEEPMGDGGLKLVEWAFGEDERNREFFERSISELGAVIAGSETYDTSLPWWRADGPTGSARRPVFVVTHEAPAESPEGASTPSSPTASKARSSERRPLPTARSSR
jgi:dihydrofolate reductase